MTQWQELAVPFPFEDIEVKPQTLSRDGTSALATPYINARAAQRRLDEVFGPSAWSFELRDVTLGGKPGMIGRLTVYTEDRREVVREDVSECSDIEPLKGAASGAFKRCFSQLGARSLYEVDLGWFPCESSEHNGKHRFKKWTDTAIRSMQAKYEHQVFGVIPDKRAEQTPKQEPKKQAPAPTPAPAKPSPDLEKVGAFIKGIGMTKDDFAAFKDQHKNWSALLFNAESEGVSSVEELRLYVAGVNK